MNPSAQALGAVLRRLRRERRLRQIDVATRAAISSAYLSQLENGLRQPSDTTLATLATVLDTDPEAVRTRAARLAATPVDEADADLGWAEIELLDATIEDSGRLRELATAAAERADDTGDDIPSAVFVMVRLALAYADGHYRALRLTEMHVLVGALVYYVLPDDTLPDFHPGGLRDDAAVLAFAAGLAQRALNDFQTWERTRK